MCTIFGIIALKPSDPEEILNYAETALQDLQHRGHEWIGLTYSNGENIWTEKRPGWVTSFFHDNELMKKILADRPQMVLAHTRYSTQGESTKRNAQPHYMRPGSGFRVLASNGDVTNYRDEKNRLEGEGCKFISTNDAELLLQHILKYSAGDDLIEGISHLMANVKASYSAWLATEKCVYLFRDPFGNRPFYFMQVGSYLIFSSEDCALCGILKKRLKRGIRDESTDINQIRPGEIAKVDLHGKIEFMEGLKPAPRLAYCAFEKIYFSRPDSNVFGHPNGNSRLCYRKVLLQTEFGLVPQINGQVEELASFRYRLGKQLAKEHPSPNADCVIAVPDSGIPGAEGYADASGLPFRVGFVRNPYIGKTFISPGQENRELQASVKYRAVRELFSKFKRIVVVDDSRVFGTTSRELNIELRSAGAQELHSRLTSAPVRHVCLNGIDMSSKGPLIAAGRTVEEVRQITCDTSLGYLSLEGLKEVIGPSCDDYCYACWTGEYRI